MSIQSVSSLLKSEVFRGMVVAGIVVDNNDPLKLLRVKVRVRELHRDVDTLDLPWCGPMNLSGGQGMNGSVGMVSVPVLGTRVLMSYLDDTQYFPVYTSWRVDGTSLPEELTEDYPNMYGMIDAAGNMWSVNTVTKVVKFHHCSGTKLEIGAEGAVDVVSAAGVTVAGHGDIKILSTGRIDMHGGANVDIRAERIDLNKSTSGTQPASVQVRTVPVAPALPSKDY